MKYEVDIMEVLLVGITLYLVYVAARVMYTVYQIERRKRIYPATLEGADETCPGHTWENVKLALKDLEFKTYSVCTRCGTIAGENKRVNAAGLAQLKESIQKRAERNAYIEELKVRRDLQLTQRKMKLIDEILEKEIDDQENIVRPLLERTFEEALKAEREVSELLLEQETSRIEKHGFSS